MMRPVWSVLIGVAASIAGLAGSPELPYFFEHNSGQADASVQFLARRPGATALFAKDRMVLRGQDGKTLSWRFPGSNTAANWESAGEPPKLRVHSFVGDRSRWRQNVPLASRIVRRGLYPGVDIVAYGKDGRSQAFEYDLIVAPRASLDPIRFEADGADHLQLDPATGDLVAGGFRHRKPIAYQEGAGGKRQNVEVRYRKAGPNRFGFEAGPYDRERPLIIDPVVVKQSTYFGGALDDAVTYSDGYYLCGYTLSPDLPESPASGRTGVDAFAARTIEGGIGALVYLGGSGDDRAFAATLPYNRNYSGLAIVGETSSRDFPTGGWNPQDAAVPVREPRPNLQMEYGGGASDGFVFILDFSAPDRYLSGYFGGSGTDRITTLRPAIDRMVVGGETDSPEFAGEAAGGLDGFAMILSYRLNRMQTIRFGGAGEDRLGALTPHSLGDRTTAQTHWAIAGTTETSDGNQDAYVQLRRVEDLSLASTIRYGGSGQERVLGSTVIGDELAVFGSTASRDLPLANPVQAQHGGGNTDGFFAIWNLRTGALRRASYWGGSGDDEINGATGTDRASGLWVVGTTSSRDLTLRDPVQAAYGGGPSDGFVAAIDMSATPYFSTYLGGPGEERMVTATPGYDTVTVIGVTDTDFLAEPATLEAAQQRRSFAGGRDTFLINLRPPITETMIVAKNMAGRSNSRDYRGMRVRVSNPEKLAIRYSNDQPWSSSLTTSSSSYGSLEIGALADSGTEYVEITPIDESTPSTRILVKLVPVSITLGDPRRRLDPAPARFPSRPSTTSTRAYFRGVDPETGDPSNDLTPMKPLNTNTPFVVESQDSSVLTVREADGYGNLQLQISRPGATKLVWSPIPGLTETDLTVDVAVELPSFIPPCPAIGKNVVTPYYFGTQWLAANESMDIQFEVSPAGAVEFRPSTVRITGPNGSVTTVAGLQAGGKYRITASGAGIQTASADCEIRGVGLQVSPQFPQSVTAGSKFDFQLRPVFLDADGIPDYYAQPFIGIDTPVTLEYEGSITGPSQATLRGTGQVLPFQAGEPGSGKVTFRLPEGFRDAYPSTTQRYEVRSAAPAVTVGTSAPKAGFVTAARVSVSGTAVAGVFRITSSDPSRLLLSTTATDEGRTEIVMPGSANNYRDFYVQGISPGEATIQATFEGAPPNAASAEPAKVTLQVEAATAYLVDTSMSDYAVTAWHPAGIIKVGFGLPARPGFTPAATLSISDSKVGRVEPAGLSDDRQSLLFRITPGKPGLATLTLESSDAIVGTTSRKFRYRVIPPSITTTAPPAVGFQLAAPIRIQPASPSNSDLGPVDVRVRSSDPSKLLLAAQAGAPGVSEIIVPLRFSGTSQEFFVHALGSQGFALMELEADGYTFPPVRVPLTGSGFVFDSPPIYEDRPWLPHPTAPTPLVAAIRLAVPGDEQKFSQDQSQQIRPGANFTVGAEITSIASSVRLSPASFVFPPASITAQVTATPTGSTEDTLIRLVPPPGFQDFGAASRRQFRKPEPSLPEFSTDFTGTFPLGQQQESSIFLRSRGPVPVDVRIRAVSSDPSKLTLSATASNQSPQGTIDFVLRSGNSGFNLYLQSMGPAGEATVTITVGETATYKVPVSIARSWLVIAANRQVTMGSRVELGATLVLDIDGATSEDARRRPWNPRAGYAAPSSIPVTMAPSGLLTDPGAVSMRYPYTQVTALAPGRVTVSIPNQPPGLTEPAGGSKTEIEVVREKLQFSVDGVGKDSMVSATIYSPFSRLLTVRSSDPSRLLLSLTATSPAVAAIELSNTGSFYREFYLHGLASSGQATLTITGDAADPLTVAVPMWPSGFVFNNVPVSMTLAANQTAQVALNAYNPQNPNNSRTVSLRSGLASVRVPVQSSDPSVLRIAEAEAVVTPAAPGKITLQGLKTGTATLSLTQPAGFGAPDLAGETRREVRVSDAFFGMTVPRVAANMRSRAQLNLQSNGVIPNSTQVTITSLRPDLLQFAAQAQADPAASVVLDAVATQLTLYLDGMPGAGGGQARFRIEAPGFRTAELDVTINPSGFHFEAAAVSVARQQAWPTAIRISPLSVATRQPLSYEFGAMFLRPGGDVVRIEVQASNADTGFSGSPVLMPGGIASLTPGFVFQNAGSTTLRIVPPEGFAEASVNGSIAVTVR